MTALRSQDDHPDRIGRFPIQDVLGRGAFSSVYLAWDVNLEREVAIKLYTPEATARLKALQRPFDEARALARLEHPRIVSIYDASELPSGALYLVSNYVKGPSLADLLASGEREGPGALHRLVRIVMEVAEALDYIHARELVHRDVKPANIVLDEGGHAVLIDFGLALDLDDFADRSERTVGTPGYMSPEQAMGESHLVDPRADIFSLGAVLYEILSGETPLNGRTIEVLDATVGIEVGVPRTLDSDVPLVLESICLRAMARRPGDRFATAGEFAEALREFLHSGQPDPAGQSGAVPVVVPRGLSSFDSGDAGFFQLLLPGPRDAQGLAPPVRFWITRIAVREDPFRVGLLYGASGSGKSSLLKAGILPHLPPSVVAVYLEAGRAGLEQQLVHRLRGRFPVLADAPNLKEILRRIRHGEVTGEGRTVLLVIDQFEQWLHGRQHGEEGASQFVQALRECDGERLQALLVVRDDFWVPVTQIFEELSEEIQTGRNALAASLFNERHARYVLETLGRAYGCVPAGELGAGHRGFLEAAIGELQSEGKVAAVKISLLVEVMKDRPWNRREWRAIGGTHGIGLSYLDACFGVGSSYPGDVAVVQKLLGALLPEPGLSLKGRSRSIAELAAAAGRNYRESDVAAVLTTLEQEYRLVAPTKDEGEPRYQLTHDFITEPIREWITGRLRDTIGGRAQLRLGELAETWERRPESRFLPTLPEWASATVFTKRRRWTPSQASMMKAAGRRYLLRLGVVLVVLLAVGIVARGLILQSRASHLVTDYYRTEVDRLSEVLPGVRRYQKWTVPVFRRNLARDAVGSDGWIRSALALQGDDQQVRADLLDHSLQAACPPTTWQAIMGNLAPLTRNELARLAEGEAGPEQQVRGFIAQLYLEQADGADDRQLDVLLDRPLRELGAWVAVLEDARAFRERLAGVVRREQPRTGAVSDRVVRNRRQARAAVALWRLGDPAPARGMLQAGDRIELRNLCAQAVAPMGVALAEVAAAYQSASAPREKMMLAQILGDYDARSASRRSLEAVQQLVVRDFREQGDAGLHSSLERALTRWEIPLPTLDESFRRPVSGRNWFVTPSGITMVVSEVPPEAKGAPRLAVATREVTCRDYASFAAATNRPMPEFRVSDLEPVTDVSLNEAMAYCNWLSRQEGQPAEQRCYDGDPPFPRGKDYYRRFGGYRLPTRDELLHAIRGDREGRRFFGEAEDLLPDYVYYYGNSGDIPHAAGRLKPNDSGLFNSQGNVREHCVEISPHHTTGADVVRTSPVGGAYVSRSPQVDLDITPVTFLPTERNFTDGFRVVRTLPEMKSD